MGPNEDQPVSTDIAGEIELQPLPEYQVQTLQTLQAKLSENAALSSEIESVIREHLRAGITADTFGRILSGLELYLEEDPAFFLLHILRFSNDSSYIDQVKAECTEQMWIGLRRLIAHYADEIRKAYTLYNENPDAWDVLNRHTYFDHLTNTWMMSLEIVKYNGERLALEESPGGALTLVRGILDMLMNVPAENAPGLYDKDYLEDTLHQFYNFINHFAPEILQEPDEKGP